MIVPYLAWLLFFVFTCANSIASLWASSHSKPSTTTLWTLTPVTPYCFYNTIKNQSFISSIKSNWLILNNYVVGVMKMVTLFFADKLMSRICFFLSTFLVYKIRPPNITVAAIFNALINEASLWWCPPIRTVGSSKLIYFNIWNNLTCKSFAFCFTR